jgi:uncharacterized membrane protein (DUF2068 family)
VVHFSSNAAALKVIVAYKLAKAALTILLTLVLIHEHLRGRLVNFADALGDWFFRTDVLDGWGDHLAHFFWHIANAHDARLFIGLVGLDAASTAVEGIGLHYRQRWAAWWVVIATAFLIPFELRGLAQHASVVRLAVLLINAAIVAYLVWRVLAHHRKSATA